ncbi:MAG: HAMP domain-containing histidine kinase [Gammaproteobacteria bacterium]|nr:HAMP domain-containing histidine kinase [Gammaproteobacteria bacterium]
MAGKFFSSLRARITIAMLCLTAVVSSMFALMIFLAFERLERTVLHNLVADEYKLLERSLREDPSTRATRTALFKSYLGSDPDLPMPFRDLIPGTYHAVEFDGRDYEVLAGPQSEQRIFIAYDITEWENLETPIISILAAGIVLTSLLAIWLGFRFSHQIIAPVTALSQRLATIDPEQRGIRLGAEFAGAEIESIADSFDRYSDRLDRFVEREQMFTSAASHELRTPLAVMQGSVDLLDEAPELSPVARRATDRIRRAMREMQEFIEALLFLSREKKRSISEHGQCELAGLTAQLVSDYRILLKHKSVELTFRNDNELLLDVPPALPTMVVSNLLRNAAENTDSGCIQVVLSGRQLCITDTGRGLPEGAKEKIFDRDYSSKSGGGMGLFLVRRICDRFGWRIDVASGAAKGTVVSVNF